MHHEALSQMSVFSPRRPLEDPFKTIGHLNRYFREGDPNFSLLGIQPIVHRFATAERYAQREEECHVPIVSLHDSIAPSYGWFAQEVWKQLVTERDIKEAILVTGEAVVFGPNPEPFELQKRGGTIFDIASSIHEGKKVPITMHLEVSAAMDVLRLRDLAERYDIANEFGWGPEQGRTDVRSYKREEAAAYVEDRGMGIVLDTSTVRLVHKYTNAGVYDYFMNQRKMPLVRELHISDFSVINGKSTENLIPGTGELGPELREIVSDARRKGIRIVYELKGYENVLDTVKQTLEYLG